MESLRGVLSHFNGTVFIQNAINQKIVTRYTELEEIIWLIYASPTRFQFLASVSPPTIPVSSVSSVSGQFVSII
jgi:hypothetical protein